MNDCPNAEIRDQLPDLLHDRLNPSARAAVLAHVDGCADCREELELLRGVRAAMVAGTPRVNVASIVRALPAPSAPRRATIRPSRPRWADWRIAATITVLAAGASSVTLLNRAHDASRNTTVVPPSAAATALPSPTPAPLAQRPADAAPSTTPAQRAPVPSAEQQVASVDDQTLPPDPAADARLSTLDESQLRTLLTEIQQMKAVPITEPDPVMIQVAPRTSPSAGEGEREGRS